MSLLLMEGFEQCRSDSDIRARGFLNTAGSSVTAAYGVLVPSSSGTPGFALSQLSAAVAAGNSLAGTSATYPNVGILNLGITINQLWQKGGFTVGFSARSNSGTVVQVGNFQQSNSATPGQGNGNMCFDGTKYWAIINNGGTYQIATSPDLRVWTPCVQQPLASGSISNGSFSLYSLYYLGGGVVGYLSSSTNVTSMVFAYTTNGGTTWSNTATLATLPTNGFVSSGIATGNASFPHLIYQENGASLRLFVGNIAGTLTNVAAAGLPTSNQTSYPATYLIGGGLLAVTSSATNTTIMSAVASSSTLNTAGAWTATTLGPNLGNALTYFAPANLWILGGAAGIATAPNAGTTGAPTFASGAVTATNVLAAPLISQILNNGTSLVALGVNGAVYTSTNGTAWTLATNQIIPAGSVYSWVSAIYDGSKWVLTTDSASGLVVTTADLANFQVAYASDKTAIAPPAAPIDGICDVFGITAAPVSNTVVTGTNNETYFHVLPASVSGGNIVVYWSVDKYGVGVQTSGNFTIPAGNGTHYYEKHFVPDPKTPNNFYYQLFVDGVLQVNTFPVSWPMTALTTDTASIAAMSPLARNQSVSQVDDIYFTINDGIVPVGPLGAVYITARRAETDVSTQWVKNGTAASNSLSTNQSAPSALVNNSVSSTGLGDTDQYASTDPVPVGRIVATTIEAYVTKTGLGVPQLQLGLKSGSTQSLGALIPGSAPNHWAPPQQFNVDPNTGKLWTQAALAASNLLLVHGNAAGVVVTPQGYRYVKLNHLQSLSAANVAIVECSIQNSAQGIDWCTQTGTLATASTYYVDGINPNQTPGNAIDGVINTSPANRWTSGNADTNVSNSATSAWWMVDLGVARVFDSVQLAVYTGFGQDPVAFTIEVSNDGTNFSVLKTVSRGAYPQLTLTEVLKT